MKYTSKQVQINKSDELIFKTLSSFAHFTPILQDKVEEWDASHDKCSFKAKGFKFGLKFEERVPSSLIKMVGDDTGVPFPMSFWIQMKGLETTDTRLRIVMDVELNMMMKMMIGNKLQNAVDTIAEQIAHAFNSVDHNQINNWHTQGHVADLNLQY